MNIPKRDNPVRHRVLHDVAPCSVTNPRSSMHPGCSTHCGWIVRMGRHRERTSEERLWRDEGLCRGHRYPPCICTSVIVLPLYEVPNHSTVQTGLFSAILTAFVIETLPMLQPDNTGTTNQLLALSVANQYRFAGVTMSEPLNNTLYPLVDALTVPFSPSSPVRSINLLFFISLILSLSASILSIRAKQWIREYNRWNAPLKDPKENVLVRQIRFEAWADWQAPLVLSSIPILLEIGMVFFIAGLTILLWTLDDVVFKITTIFIGFFLITISALTVAPIISKRCPYRSPTAWACLTAYRLCSASISPPLQVLRNIYVILFHLLLNALQPALSPLSTLCVTTYCSVDLIRRACRDWTRQSMLSAIRHLNHSEHHVDNFQDRHGDAEPAKFFSQLAKLLPQLASFPIQWKLELPETWRELDLQICDIQTVRHEGKLVCPEKLQIIASQNAVPRSVRQAISPHYPQAFLNLDVYPTEARTMLIDLLHGPYLLRALSWVQQSSQTSQVNTYIAQCSASFFHEPQNHRFSESYYPNITVLRCFLSWLCHESPARPIDYLLEVDKLTHTWEPDK